MHCGGLCGRWEVEGGAESAPWDSNDPIMQHSSVRVLLLVAPSLFGGFSRLHIDNKSQAALVQILTNCCSCLPSQFFFVFLERGTGHTAAPSRWVVVPTIGPRCQIMSGGGREIVKELMSSCGWTDVFICPSISPSISSPSALGAPDELAVRSRRRGSSCAFVVLWTVAVYCAR